jgi:hypothetical protein
MWLALLFVIIMLAGVGLTIASGGIFGIILIVLGVIALVVSLISGGAAAKKQSREPAERTGPETGYAHRGQEHMTG